MQVMEGSFDTCTEQLFEVTLKLEEKEKAYGNAESDVGSLSRRTLLLEEEEENDKLEVQLKDDKYTLAESERKYEDIARKLATKEDEMARSNERCTGGGERQAGGAAQG